VAAIALASLGAGACLGGVNRVYDDGGSGGGTDSSVGPDTAGGHAEGGAGGDASSDVASDVVTAGEGAAPEGAPAPDAPADAAPDAAAEAEAEAGQTYLCNGQPVTSCASCGTQPVECVFCAFDGTHPGVCAPKGQYCQNWAPPQTNVCQCGGNNLSACIAPFQVCTLIGPSDYCQTCGEMGSGGHACKGGGTCNETTGTCS
jgi:hypothetical protein